MPFTPVTLQPGLVVRLLRRDELPAHADAVDASGLYQDGGVRVLRWWRSPSIWPTVVEWHGRVLQYDYFHLEPERTVKAGLTLRPTRDRAQWFWREMRRPVLEQLLAAGFRRMHSAIRADRRDWIASMVRMWEATETGVSKTGKWVHVDYDLPTCLRIAQGAAVSRRRRLPGWTWSRDGVTVREATGVELAGELPRRLADDWAASSRGDQVLTLLEDGVALDRGTVLVTEVGGVIREARMIRPRGITDNGPLGNLVALTRVEPLTAGRVAAAEGLYRWALAAGYEQLVMWVPAAQLRLADLMARLRRVGWAEGRVRRPGGHGPNHEFRLDLSAALEALA